MRMDRAKSYFRSGRVESLHYSATSCGLKVLLVRFPNLRDAAGKTQQKRDRLMPQDESKLAKARSEVNEMGSEELDASAKVIMEQDKSKEAALNSFLEENDVQVEPNAKEDDASSKEESALSKREKAMSSLSSRVSELESQLSAERERSSSLMRKESYLLMRLATKERQMQSLRSKLLQLKEQVATVKSGKTMVEPAVNLLVERLTAELAATKSKLEASQEELSAWKFTPDSTTGKRLMSKCRQLLQENEEIAKNIESGNVARMENEIELQKKIVSQMKEAQKEMDEFVQEADEDMEGLQGTILVLQQQLREAHARIKELEANQTERNENYPKTEQCQTQSEALNLKRRPEEDTEGNNEEDMRTAKREKYDDEDEIVKS